MEKCWQNIRLEPDPKPVRIEKYRTIAFLAFKCNLRSGFMFRHVLLPYWDLTAVGKLNVRLGRVAVARETEKETMPKDQRGRK